MKNIIIPILCLFAFSMAQAKSLTCTSSKRQGPTAKITGSEAQLISPQGNVYVKMYLLQDSEDSVVYKSVGEFSTALKMSMNLKTGRAQAEIFHITKGGTRLAQVLDRCR